MRLLLELLLLLRLALAAPFIAFPVNAQVPPVGRVGNAFSFIMAPFTFQDAASPSTIPTYSVSNTPKWLQFAQNTRAFSGTPESSDVGASVFNLTATSASGSTTAPVTFIVSDRPEISIQESFASQAGHLGLPANGDGGIIAKAATPFNFSFSPDTFIHRSTISMYYAVSGDNSPLPSWISFDEKTLSFAGIAPSITSLIAPPQYFHFNFIAADYVGFAGGNFPFSIVIGAHILELKETMFTETAKDGENFKFTLPLSSILLDTQPITSASIASVTANVTNWLGFDNSTITLSGIPMSKNDSTVVSISITDVFRDTVTARVAVDVDGNMPHVYNSTNTTESANSSSVSNSSLSSNASHSLFTSTIPNVNATQGGFFLYTINSTFLKSDNVQLKPSYDPANDAGWITFNPSNNSFYGIPTDNWTNITVSLTATLNGIQRRDSPRANTTSFVIHSVVAGTDGTHPASTSSATSNSGSGSNKGRTIGIIVGSVLGAAILLILLILLIWCCRRRRREKKLLSPTRSYSPHDAISRPLPNAPEMQAWPVMDEKWDEPRRLSALKIFKRNSGLSGFVAEVPSPTRERGMTPATSQPGVALAVDTHLANRGAPKLISPLNTPRGPPGYGQPRKSWRAKDGAERDWFDTTRNSEASLATVSTNEIFSVRLVDSPKTNSEVGFIASPNNPFRSTMASQPSSIAPTVVPIFEHPPMPQGKMPNIDFPVSDSRMTIGSYSSSDENNPVRLGPEQHDSPSEQSDLYSTTEGSSPPDNDYLDHDHSGSSRGNHDRQRQGGLVAHEGKWFGDSSDSFESARNARIGTAQVVRSPRASPQAKLVEFTKRRPVSSENRSPNFGSETGEMLADNDNDPVFL